MTTVGNPHSQDSQLQKLHKKWPNRIPKHFPHLKSKIKELKTSISQGKFGGGEFYSTSRTLRFAFSDLNKYRIKKQQASIKALQVSSMAACVFRTTFPSKQWSKGIEMMKLWNLFSLSPQPKEGAEDRNDKAPKQ